MNDFLDDFLNPNKIFEPVVVPTGIVNGRVKDDYSSDEETDFQQDGDKTTDYAKEYQLAEEKLYARGIREQDKLLCVDDIDERDLSENVARLREQTEVFNKYTFTRIEETNLPIEYYKTSIIDHLNSNSVLIIQGPTGCGKTTQVPQYILDYCRENNTYCNIVVTQPRRIAAISVAKRVCVERGWALGSVCGYQVALEKCRSGDTILSYVTTGVLLQSLIKVKSLQNYTHIIIDEVHERSQEMDFLLVLIRKFLYTNSINTKVILMSATFDTMKFQTYFKTNCSEIDIYPPTLHVLKESNFNIQHFYLDQLVSLGPIPRFNKEEPKIDKSLYDMLSLLIRIFDRLDKGDEKASNVKTTGSVLVFLPGIYEIEEAYNHLNSNSFKKSEDATQWYIRPLHSSITNEEQRKVFLPPQKGFRKIILSTNIAESSITVPDIRYVIDFCLTKTMVVNPETKYESLQLQWASHVNCTQRAGRVGRVTDGRVYRFVPVHFYETELNKDITPEILRAPLERIVLGTKLLELDDPPKAILALLIDPPNLGNIESTIWSLKEVGGLALTCRGSKVVSDGDLTFLGQVMADLPMNVNLSKLIFLGHIFSCLKDCIIMAAGCSLANVFSSPFQEKIAAYMNRLQWADGSCSDLISYLNLFKVWEHKKRTNAFIASSSTQNEKAWARTNFVNIRALNEWNILINEIIQRCARLGIKESVGQSRVLLDHVETPLFLKVAMCGAFYPNYFKRSCDGGQIDEREAVKILGGRDPCKTVYFKEMDRSLPGPLYARRIKQLFSFSNVKMNVLFDNSFRVYVEFNPVTASETVQVDGRYFVAGMPGKICKEVYCAVRRRQLKMNNVIKCLPVADSWNLAASLGLAEKSSMGNYTLIRKPRIRQSNNSVLPDLDIQYIKIFVSMAIDVSHFWAQNVDEETAANLHSLQKHLNAQPLPLVPREDIAIEGIYAAKYDDGYYYRCKVIPNNHLFKEDAKIVQVIFIDYGDIRSIQIDSLYEVPMDVRIVPPQAMECVLSEVQPFVVSNPKADAEFEKFTKDSNLYGKVYSVVNGIVHLELFKDLPGNDNAKSLNQLLIEKGYAQKAEESFLSKENHSKRENIYDSESASSRTITDDDNFIDAPDVKPPNELACTKSIYLKGPFSPLEMQIFSVMESGLQKTVAIEGTSVNSVLLDTDPQDPHERLIVAVSVGENVSGRTLSLRHTTVMPNIHGFSVLMALLFCPTMEPKPLADGSRFGAILCGLGAYENSNRSMHPAHDMVFTLDTELTQAIINEVNEIRYYMNLMVRTMDCISHEMETSVNIEHCQQEIKNRLLATLKKPRKSMERAYMKHANVWHKFLYHGTILECGEHSAMENDIWPLHWTIALKEENEQTVAYKENLREMDSFARRMKTMSETTCKLCNTVLYSVPEVRLHLASKVHKDNVEAVSDVGDLASSE